MNKDLKLAMLIDAENISEKYTKYILDEITKYGTPTYKRMYGDWRQQSLTKWKDTSLNYSIIPMHQFTYSKGKSASDSAMIIDAMDILYTSNVDGFCLVSSDSDFTRLASRLREAGKFVLGMGEKKTPKAFITACDKFVYLEVLLPENNKNKNNEHKENENLNRLIKVISDIIRETANDDGYAYLADVGNVLNKREPDFDARNYGYLKFSELIANIPKFEIVKYNVEGKNVSHIYVKIRENKKKKSKNKK